MKAFFQRYSYESVRLFLNQFAISIFGFALSMTVITAEKDNLLPWCSLGAIAFYLALTYGTAWKTGSGDRLGVRHGSLPYRPLTGLYCALLANSVNLLLAILLTLGHISGLAGLEDIPRSIALLLQGMYMGVLATFKVGTETLNGYWWSYFLIVLPALLVSTVGYLAGVKDFHLTKMNIPEFPESDRPSKQELREKKALEKRSRK